MPRIQEDFGILGKVTEANTCVVLMPFRTQAQGTQDFDNLDCFSELFVT